MNKVQVQVAAQDRALATAHDPAWVPSGEPGVVARTMMVGLSPERALATLVAAPHVRAKRLASESFKTHEYDRGLLFYERTSESSPDTIVLWRRPEYGGFRGMLEPVPYPDCLHIRLQPRVSGCQVQMCWQRHPLTRTSLRFHLFGGIVGFVGLIAFLAFAWTLIPSMMPLLAALVVGLPISAWTLFLLRKRLARTRQARAGLMEHAYRALGADELASSDKDPSAFRVSLPAGHEG